MIAKEFKRWRQEEQNDRRFKKRQRLCEALKGRISHFDCHGLHVTIGNEGEIAISVRFEEAAAMTPFEQGLPTLREDVKQALVFK